MMNCIQPGREENVWSRLKRWGERLLSRGSPPQGQWEPQYISPDASVTEVADLFTKADCPLPGDRLDVLLLPPQMTGPQEWQPWASAIATEVRQRRSDGTLVLLPVIVDETTIEDHVITAFDLTIPLDLDHYTDLERVAWSLQAARGELHRLPPLVELNVWSLHVANASSHRVAADLSARKFRSAIDGGCAGAPLACVVDAPQKYLRAVHEGFASADVLGTSSQSGSRITAAVFGQSTAVVESPQSYGVEVPLENT